MTAPSEQHAGNGPVTTVVPKPRQRIFRQLTPRGRFAAFAWRWVSRLLYYPSPIPGYAWRRLILRCFGASVARSVKIHRNVRIIHPWNLTLGPGATVRQGCVLDCQAPITIGAQTQLSQYVHLCTATHTYDRRDMPIIGQPIRIGDHCWLAADVFVGCGVSIGEATVVGARSGVFRDLPPGVIATGNPAKVVKPRQPQQHP